MPDHLQTYRDLLVSLEEAENALREASDFALSLPNAGGGTTSLSDKARFLANDVARLIGHAKGRLRIAETDRLKAVHHA